MRRSHRKTRTGCAQCKRRRVKCDERKPSCANCDRKNLECSLLFLTPISSLPRSENSPFLTPSGRTRTMKFPRSPSPPSFSPPPSTLFMDPFFTPKIHELFHHYTTVLCHSLAGNRSPNIWQFSIPRMALSHHFLLHGILAVSALHLSTLLPYRKNDLRTLASSQEYLALPTFRASVMRPNARTIHAIFAFSSSVVLYILASSMDQEERCRIPSKDDENPHWFLALRGVMTLLSSHWMQLAQGPFAPLLARDPGPNHYSDNPDYIHLEKLESMFPSPHFSPATSSSLPTSALEIKNDHEIEICRTALAELRRISALPYSPSKTLCMKTAAHIWPGSISSEFVDLIHDRRPEALVVLGHFCVILKKLDSVWYFKGLGVGLLGSIERELGCEWQHWLAWAKEQTVE